MVDMCFNIDIRCKVSSSLTSLFSDSIFTSLDSGLSISSSENLNSEISEDFEKIDEALVAGEDTVEFVFEREGKWLCAKGYADPGIVNGAECTDADAADDERAFSLILMMFWFAFCCRAGLFTKIGF